MSDLLLPYYVRESVAGMTSTGKPYQSLLLVDANGMESRSYYWNCMESLRGHVLVLRGGVPDPNAKGFVSFDETRVASDLGLFAADAELVSTYTIWSKYLDFLPTLEMFDKVVRALLKDWIPAEGVSVEGYTVRQRVVVKVLEDLPNLFKAYSGCIGGRRMHHTYKGGLLAHTYDLLAMAIGMRRFILTPLDWFVFTLATLYHDYGKLNEYEGDEYTETLVLWPHTVGSAVYFKEVYGSMLSEALLERILHCILAHHGGADSAPTAVRPSTQEALLLSQLDLYDARSNAMYAAANMEFVSGMNTRIVNTACPLE